MGSKYGYARVSTSEQNLDRQLDMLRERGAETIFTEKISGVKRSRPELDRLLSALEEGDTAAANPGGGCGNTRNEKAKQEAQIRATQL